MKTKISKYILKNLVLNEMAYPSTFNIEVFNNIRTFKGRKEYCDQRLQKIASGSSRIVYKIDDDKCLKLAKNTKGIAQNDVEIYNSFIRDYLGAEIYNYSENGEWLEMQLARKAKKSDFKRITGYTFDTISQYIAHCYNEYGRGTMYCDEQLAKLFNKWWREGTDEFYDSIFGDLYEYLLNSTLETVGDLQRISSWGIVIDENGEDRLVIIDYGLDDEVWRNYYCRR